MSRLPPQAWWDESIRVLGSFHFLDSLLEYDKDGMTPQMAEQVRSLGHG